MQPPLPGWLFRKYVRLVEQRQEKKVVNYPWKKRETSWSWRQEFSRLKEPAHSTELNATNFLKNVDDVSKMSNTTFTSFVEFLRLLPTTTLFGLFSLLHCFLWYAVYLLEHVRPLTVLVRIRDGTILPDAKSCPLGLRFLLLKHGILKIGQARAICVKTCLK